MTNAEKFLKDGVVAKELWKTFQVYYYKNKDKESDVEKAFRSFFEQEAKPTLTEDERVILRNIKEFNYIGRNEDNDLYLLFKYSETYTEKHYIDMFRHLFQFIGERRRI